MIFWKKSDSCNCNGDHNGEGHYPFWRRPGLSRREFFNISATGLAGYYFAPLAAGQTPQLITSSGMRTKNTARHTIFILLAGAPSHVDTFDLKEGPWLPTDFAPTSYDTVRFPQGLMPTLASQIQRFGIVRSMRAWAVVHQLSQTWAQIGRNPTAVLGKVAPHIGSIVSIEKSSERRTSDILPPFISLNPGGTQVGSGFLSSSYAPFGLNPSGGTLTNTTHPDGQARFSTRQQLLQALDGPMRIHSPYGATADELDAFSTRAQALMYNPVVTTIFALNSADRVRYGSTGFGDACLTARALVENDKGSRFIQITHGGWDHHSNIYQPGTNLRQRTRELDMGLGNLLSDLGQSGLLDNTLVVAVGEFGRTVGGLNAGAGRDHYFQQFALLAGAGINGGRAIGATDDRGAATVAGQSGWSRGRDVRPEDIEATIYSAMGIDWTSIRYDDPFGRGFEYVPFSKDDVYGPINELWA
jgi:hypothetical protein